MPTVTVKDTGTILRYEDSGAPPNSTDYSTIFLIHGHVFHAPIFRRMFPHGASRNLRFFAINQREYPGSSPLTDSLLVDLCSPDLDTAGAAVFEQVKEIAYVVAHLIKTEDIPAPVEVHGKKTGGVSILAWSGGNSFLLSLLANGTTLDTDVQAVLYQYLTTAFIYDPPSLILGHSKPSKAYAPLEDPAIPLPEIANHFIPWVAAYYQPFSTLSEITALKLEQNKDMSLISSDPKYTATTARMSDKERAEVTHPAAAMRSPVRLFDAGMTEAYQKNLRHALFNTGGAWKGVKAVVLWADMTCVYCLWAAKLLWEMSEEPTRGGERRRNLEIVKLENANHFLHYDEPERFVNVLADNAL